LQIISIALVSFLTLDLFAADEKTAYNFQLDSGIQKALSESAPSMWKNELLASVRFPSRLSLSAETEVSHTFVKYRDQGDFLEVDDILLYARYPVSSPTARYRMAPTAGLNFPTSQASQKAGMRMGYFVGLYLSRPAEIVDLRLVERLFLFDYRYTTDSSLGSEPNSWGMLENAAVATIRLRQFSIENSVALYVARNYAGHTVTSYRMRVRPQWQWNSSLAIFGSAQWRDRVESYNPFLDPDTATVGAGISYTF